MTDHEIPTEPDEALPPEDYGDGITWRRKWLPTPKWMVALVVGLHGLLLLLVQQEWVWTDVMTIATATLVTERLVAYIAPNGTRRSN